MGDQFTMQMRVGQIRKHGINPWIWVGLEVWVTRSQSCVQELALFLLWVHGVICCPGERDLSL